MSYILGIDTGGTYTDGVIVDKKNRAIIAKAKSLTTRENLSLGISDVISRMRFDGERPIEFVALSTTLATNAIVEGRGCQVGLIMIGFDQQEDIPAREVCYVAGGHDIRGREKAPFDEAAFRQALARLQGQVDALAISAYLSVRNPEHELAAQKIALAETNMPVVCAHHLTRSLGMRERSVTAVLNARLLPIIDELIAAVKVSLGQRGLNAPIMIVKGDGSLMGESQAREKPIETILSGPAASIIGANYLAGEKNGMVLDMGGTTSDIAILHNGTPKLNKDGARVGGWQTKVEAADIDTYGLGGDSYLQKDVHGGFKLGPQRVWPLSLMCARYPHLINELEHINLPPTTPLIIAQVTDCYILLNEKMTNQYSQREREIIEVVRDKPHSIFHIARQLGTEVNMLDPERLVETGVLGRISMTPTDILHVKGLYSEWSVEGAVIGAQLLSRRFGLDAESFCDFVIDKTTERLAYVTWQTLFNHDGGKRFDLAENDMFSFLSNAQLRPGDQALFTCHITPTLPVIGIGAPVRVWLPLFAERIGARLVIPEHTEVANAVGAAVGRIMEAVRILIAPGDDYLGYVLHSAWERKYFEKLDEALAYAMEYARDKAEALARENGAQDIQVTVEHEDTFADANQMKVFVESCITAIGTEASDWQ